jgi:glycosyltransferase involved in cell wall biosynthesis
MRVALIHDWLLANRGGEKVLDAIAQLCPEAELFTLLADRDCLTPPLSRLKLHISWLDALPGSHRFYRNLLPLMPAAIERFDLQGFDLVISSSHCVAKGVRPPPGVPHLCYCHTPMRYAWHLRDVYVQSLPAYRRSLVRIELDRLRAWDRRTASRVTQFIANGRTVQQRIRDAYGRDSSIIHPPVDIDFYRPADGEAGITAGASPPPGPPLERGGELGGERGRVAGDHRREEFYLVVSALAPNKRVDLAVEACGKLDRELIIIGTGSEESRLRKAAGPKTQFLGWRTDAELRDHYRRCRALLFPGEEDFGIVPIEANACGTAVIAYGVGGATETIVPPEKSNEPTGLWFSEPSADSLLAAIERFESQPALIRPEACRRQAEQFSGERFRYEMSQVLRHYKK